MLDDQISKRELLRRLRALIEDMGVVEASKLLGVSRVYLQQIRTNKRRIDCPAVLKHFGYVRSVVLTRKVSKEKEVLTKIDLPLY